jgi:hypothetical protein
MSELEFLIYTDKGMTLPYYRLDDTIYDHHLKIKSEDFSSKIRNDINIQYYSNTSIMSKIESAALFVNIIYDDEDENFHSTYVILSSTENKLRIIIFEDLIYAIDDYVPYEFVALNNNNKKFPPLNENLLRPLSRRNGTDISDIIDSTGLRLKYYQIEPSKKPRIDSKTGFPSYVLFYDLRVTFITYKEFKSMRKNKEIYRFFVEKEVQVYAKPPNILFIVFGINGMTYLLNAYHNKEKNTIHAPI